MIGFRPDEYADRDAWRRTLEYGDEPLVVCSVGGTAIGRRLLELCGQAHALLRERLRGARMVLVCGPRLPVEAIRVPNGVEVRGHVPRLYEHFACCDVAVGQCGASSTTELSALRKPFIYFPIDGHYEQELVAARLRRHGLGRRMSLRDTTPEMLADAIHQEYGRSIADSGLPVGGAARAAEHILALSNARPAAWPALRPTDPPSCEVSMTEEQADRIIELIERMADRLDEFASKLDTIASSTSD